MKVQNRYQFLAIFVFLFVMFLLPIAVNDQTLEQKTHNVDSNNAAASSASVDSIFGNNEVIALLTSIPIFGVGYIAIVMLNTGQIAASYSYPVWIYFLNPFTYVELGVYAFLILYMSKAFILFVNFHSKEHYHRALDYVKSAVAYGTVILFVSAVCEILWLRMVV